jgi:Domain of unknown function (DUF4328)/Protein of unknown function (DUF2510)
MQDSSPWGQGGSGPQPPAEPAAPPPNWYPDPQDAARFRYWDGTRWTERTRPAATTPMAAAYRPLGGPARALEILLATFLLVTLVAIAFDWLELSMLTRLLHDPDSVSVAEADASDTRQAVVTLLQLGCWVATAVGFLVWFQRAYANLPRLGMEPLRFGPGWSVGGWFVPFLNLVRPKQIMDDIWRGSDPDRPPAQLDGAWHGTRVPVLLHLWWAVFLLSWVLDRLLLAQARGGGDSVQALRTGSASALISDAVDVLLGLLALQVVLKVTRRQQARASRLAAGSA